MCGTPATFPTGPANNQMAAFWMAEWARGEQMDLGFWREVGPSGCTILYLRVEPRFGAAPFLCSSSFSMIQGSGQYTVKLTRSVSGSSFCDDLFIPSTFIVQPWTAPLFNIDAPLKLVHDGVRIATSGTIPAYTPAQQPPPVAAPLSPQIGLWWNPAESGTGYTIDVQGGVLIMQIYSYRADGEPQWYLTAGQLSNGNRNYTGTLDKYRAGQCISCTVYKPPTLEGSEGAVSVVFNSNTAATVALPGGRVTNIVPF